MQQEIVFSGFGGQGALFAGQLMTYAGMNEDREVTWIPSYGPEMRGGTAHCTVIISDQPIGSPIIRNPTIAVVLNPESMIKYEPLVRPGGLLLINSTLVRQESTRSDIDVISIPANDLASDLGNVKMANVVMLGALLAARPVVPLETIGRVLDEHLHGSKRRFIEPNKRALERGAAYVRERKGAQVGV
jgi:2-oxoglutarate ferredoxin oxidoreductase subunit gamma